MNMIAALALLLVQDQEPTHRIHLRNGNVLDGVLIRTDGKKALITFRLAVGAVHVRYADVSRMPERAPDKCCEGVPAGHYRVHSIRPRTKGEKAVLTPVEEKKDEPKTDEKKDTTTQPKTDTTKTDTTKTDTTKTDTTKKSDTVPVEPTNPPTTPADVRRRIDEHLKKIRSATPEERDRMSLELAQMGSGALEYLADLVDRVEDALVPALLTALHGQKDPRAVAILFDKTRSKSAAIRVAVLQTLMSAVDKDAASRFRGFLQDPDPNVRATAINVLQKLEDEDSIELIARLAGDPEPNVGRTASSAVATMAPRFEKVDEVVAILKDLLPRSKGRSLAQVIEAIGKMGRKEAADSIIEFIGHPEKEVRASVARACSLLRAEETAEALIGRLSEETEQWVKVQICEALGAMKSKKAIESLIDLMERDEDKEVDEAARRNLEVITGKEGFGQDHEKWREWWDKVKERNEGN